MNKAQEEGLKHLEELQNTISFLKEQVRLLQQINNNKDEEIRRLYREMRNQHIYFHEEIEKIPLIAELAKRELNKTLENLCKLSKRERGTRRDILRRLGLDDTYNKE